jgi:hypothetical protein
MIVAHMVNILNRDPELVSFTKYDPRGTGFISADDLSGVLKGWNVILTPKQVKWIYTLFDRYKSGNLDYRAFAERILDDRDTSKLGVEKSASTEKGLKALKERVKINFKSLREAFRHYDGYVLKIRFLCFICACFLLFFSASIVYSGIITKVYLFFNLVTVYLGTKIKVYLMMSSFKHAPMLVSDSVRRKERS